MIHAGLLRRIGVLELAHKRSGNARLGRYPMAGIAAEGKERVGTKTHPGALRELT